MGKRKGVKASTNVNKNKNGNGNGETPISTSSTSMKRTRGENKSTDNKIRGGEISSKKMKRGEASNSCVGIESSADQSQESSDKEVAMDNLPPESANANKEEKPSTSSSYWTRSRKEAQDPEVKELKLSSKREKDEDDSSNSPGQDEAVEAVTEGPINDLPPEMLTQILQCVNIRSLFNCRLVNRNWRAIASGILRNRSNSFTGFKLDRGRLVWRNAEYNEYNRTSDSLSKFVRCMKKSKDSPFSQFSFSMIHHDGPFKILNREDFKQFTSYFDSSSQRLKCLSLSIGHLNNIQMFQLLPQQLSELLLNKIPRLEELALNFYDSIKAPEVKLFSIDYEENSEINTDQVQFQLTNLKVLRFQSPITSFAEFIKDLLNAAVNLKYLHMRIYSPSDFQFVHSLGKLHLLKEATIQMDRELLSATESNKNSAPLHLPKLEILELRMLMRDGGANSWNQAADFLEKLFESSKDTLSQMTVHPFGFLTGLQLPTFTKLRKLELSQCDYSKNPLPVFPPGIRSRDVFPVVSELDLDIEAWASAFPQEDSIPLLPHVKTLRMNDFKLKENAISILALMCPNLETLKIHKDNECRRDAPTLNFSNIGRAIWTHMKQLESLEIDVNLDGPENTSTALDSCFTGISVENCQRLYKLKKANKTPGKGGSQAKIPESEFAAEREHPSILDMKDLKTLIIHPHSRKALLKRTDFFTKLTWISQEYAFQFVPHLKPKPEEED